MYNAVLICYVSNVGIVWFYILIITIVLYPYYSYCSYCFYYLFIYIVLIFYYQSCYWVFKPVGT